VKAREKYSEQKRTIQRKKRGDREEKEKEREQRS
jgi:hypothetical protein